MPKIRVTKHNPFGLSAKQRAFVDEYVISNNGQNAALKAYETDNIDVAKSIACENLTKPYMIQALEHKLKAKDLTVDLVLNELMQDALHKCTEQCAGNICATIRTKSLELLGKYLKMFTDKVDHTHALEGVRAIGWNVSHDKKSENVPRETIVTQEHDNVQKNGQE